MTAPAPGPDFTGDARFELRRRLGAGAYGVVYEALDRQRGEVVALKTLRELQPEALYRFKREFRALADVRHDNLVRLHELVSVGEHWLFTMELVEGRDFLAALGVAAPDSPRSINGLDHTVRVAPGELAELAARTSVPTATPVPQRATPDPARLRPLLRQLAAGVVALHRRGMEHRDLKPSNVLVTPVGRVVILDFGLVAERHTRRSDAAQIVGTVEYMAPEQAAGLPSTPASDWYSVGVMLFEALTGALPFTGSLLEMLTQRIERDAPSVRALCPDAPSDLAALCMALLARDPGHRPDDDEVLALLGSNDPATSSGLPRIFPPAHSAAHSSASHAAANLLGRDAELARLSDALADARAGHTSLVRLHAAPGLGRSALLDHFLATLEQSLTPAVILAARCGERESVPYKGIDGLIDALARELHSRDDAEVAALLPQSLPLLARLFPVLRRVPAIARAAPLRSSDDLLAPHELRQQAFTALRTLLTTLSASAPLVLALDDLHWGDRDSAALLRELLSPPDPPPLLLIASHRDDRDPGPCVRALLGLSPHPGLIRRDLSLDPLDTDAATALARALLAGSPRRDDASALAREAAGNPRFLAELCRFVRDQGDDGGDDTDLAGFDALLRRRIAGLDLASRVVLEVVAVTAEPIDPTLVAAVARHPGDIIPIVAALRREHLLRSHRADGLTTIEPFHDRITAAILADIDDTRVRQIHRDLADTLERAEHPDIERLRVHLAAAGETERAAAYTLQAAARASGALAFERAAALYRDALTHAAPGERPRLEALLGEALASDGRGIEAAEAFLRASAAQGGEPALDLLRRAGFERLRGGQIDEGTAVLRQVLASVGMQLAHSRGRALLALVIHRLALALRGLHFRERAEAAIPHALLRRADVAWSVGASGLGMVDDIAAGQFQSLALRLSLQAGEPLRICRALAGEVAFSAVGGTRSQRRTARLLHTARTLAERLDQPHVRGTVAMTAGIAAYLGGRFRDAHEASDAAEAILRRCPDGAWDLVNAQIFGLAAQVYRGELAAIGRRVAPLLREAADRGNLYLLACLRGGPTILHTLARGAVDEAAASIDEAERRWSARGVPRYWQFHSRCQLDLYRGDPAAARARQEREWSALGTLLRVQFVRVEALHLRGRCLLATGGPDRQILADARTIEAQQAPWGDPLAKLLRAGVAARAGDTRTAIHHLADAAAGCDAAGLCLFAAAARRRRGELEPGSDGARWRAHADTWLKTQDVADIPRLLAMLTPGFRDA